MRLFMLLVTLLCGLVAGNTEIRHFRPNGDATAQPIDKAGQQQQLSALIPNHTTLTAPYTSTGVEVIHALESADHGSEEKERWYVLRGLDAGHSYELRVSYAASTPSDFYIDLYSVSGFARLHNITLEPVPGTERELVMYTRVTASHTGVSNISGMEKQPVPYIFVLERHVLGIPVQALKLVAVLVVVIAFALFYVTPRFLATVDSIMADERSKED